MNGTLTLVLGGARSGKSRYAESLVLATAWSPVYLATAQALDREMELRIAHHRQDRDAAWITVEEPLDLAGRLLTEAKPGRAVLVDCLTLWLTNLMTAGLDVEAEIDQLLAALPNLAAPVVFVANEVGLGIVPDNAMARLFQDHAGRLNQRLAQRCSTVLFMAAGLPLVLKGGT